jgi:nucleoid-associated protein YgaU
MVTSKEKAMSSATASIGTAQQLRLTFRGRAVTLAVFLAVLFASMSVWNARSAAVPDDAARAPASTVVAEPGETLWDIAVEVDPLADPRATIEKIIELNGLRGPVSIDAGQPIVVPTG